MRSLLKHFLVGLVLVCGGVALASMSVKRSAKAKPVRCMNDHACQLDEKCVKYPPQTEGFCSRSTDLTAPNTFQPPVPDNRQPAGRANCTIAAEGHCLKEN